MVYSSNGVSEEHIRERMNWSISQLSGVFGVPPNSIDQKPPTYELDISDKIPKHPCISSANLKQLFPKSYAGHDTTFSIEVSEDTGNCVCSFPQKILKNDPFFFGKAATYYLHIIRNPKYLTNQKKLWSWWVMPAHGMRPN